jgi:hypothetical protein
MKNTVLLLFFLFTFSFESYSQAPPNDLIENATNVISLPFLDNNVQTQNATPQNPGALPCDSGANFSRVYYRFVPSEDVTLTVKLLDGDIDSSYVTFHQSSVSTPTSNDQLSLINGEFCSFNTEKTFDLIAGTVYYIIIGNPSMATDIVFFQSDLGDVVDIPDANLKNKLLNDNDVDINGNGEIEVEEALLMNVLNINGSSITDLTGLESFSNLETLFAEDNNISFFDFATLPNLRTLNIRTNLFSSIDLTQNSQLEIFFCDFNQFSFLDVTQNTNLETFTCAYNNLSVLNVSQNVFLRGLSCPNNQLSTLDLSQNNLLDRLDCRSNELTTLDVSANTLITELRCDNNQLSTLDLSQNTLLELLWCGFNQLTTLDLSQNVLLEVLFAASNLINTIDLSENILLTNFRAQNNMFQAIDLSENVNLAILDLKDSYFLENINLKNGNNSLLVNSFNGQSNFRASNCPNLETICVDDVGYASTFLNTFISPQSIFVEDCSVNSANYNLISGVLTFDEDNNGCDSTQDPIIPNMLVIASDGVNEYGTFTNNIGDYTIDVPTGNFTTSVFGLSVFYNLDPITATSNFTNLGETNVLDFCATVNQSFYDLEVLLLPITEARPGFNALYQLVYKNNGLTVVSGSVSFEFNDSQQVFVSSSENPDINNPSSLTFNFTDLQPFETRTIDITMTTFQPPTVNDGDVLNMIASVLPNDGDFTPDNNTYDLDQIVINSFDPNDKQVLQGSEILLEQTNDYLDYLIRFQNTGTASAINVTITDQLDDLLDWSTVQPISSSHSYQSRITNGNFLEFIFENINLPAEQDDSSGSNGFVAFRIKPKFTVDVGDIIAGSANIYFDFNAPIITNTVSTEIVEPLSVDEIELEKAIIIYPNPNSGFFNIQLKDNVILEKTELFSLTGQKIYNSHVPTLRFDLTGYPSGVYFIRLTTNIGIVNRQILKD